jgi:hypothetical protein
VVAGLDQLRSQLIRFISRRPVLTVRAPDVPLLTSMRHILLLGALLLAGCTTGELPGADTLALRPGLARPDSAVRARQDSIDRATPGYVIDSLLPPDEERRRFHAAYPGDSATAFTGGSPSRDALARRFIRALAVGDTVDLRRAVVTPREFADIYYPDSPYASGPYHQPIGFAWEMIQSPSEAGLRKLRRMAGQPIAFVGQRCEAKVLREGAVDRYTGCLVRIVDARGDTVTKRAFGSIVSFRGTFKFLSFTNDL